MANGIVLWRGTSRIDGKTPVVAIATGLARPSSNAKTGAMVQTYILRADMAPLDAVMARADGAICGGCIHRKQRNGKRSCYVNVGQAPTLVWRALQREGYRSVFPAEAARMVAGRFVRLGTYGDPAAVPVSVWKSFLSLAGGYTGYTHQWRSAKFAALASLCQASCETEEDVALAHSKGFRGTFRVIPVDGEAPNDAMLCPASAEAGRVVQCADCRACDGSRDVYIHAHGAGRNNYAVRALPVIG